MAKKCFCEGHLCKMIFQTETLNGDQSINGPVRNIHTSVTGKEYISADGRTLNGSVFLNDISANRASTLH